MNAPEIVRADPALRRKALLILVGGALAGTAVIGFGLPALQAWATEQIAAGRLGIRRLICFGMGPVIVALASGVIASGLNMIHIGRRVLAAERFPPPGLRVLRDTPVIDGPRAVFLGRSQTFIGAMLLVCAVVLLGLGSYIVFLLWPVAV